MSANRMTGWLLAGIGVLMAIGGFAIGMPIAGLFVGAMMGLGAWLSIYMAGGDLKPLDDATELYRWGRPANAEVLSVEDITLAADGTRTAKLSVRVSPVNESRFKSTRTVALPGGAVPAVGSTVTVKFDPDSRRNFVLMEETVAVTDHVTASLRSMGVTA